MYAHQYTTAETNQSHPSAKAQLSQAQDLDFASIERAMARGRRMRSQALAGLFTSAGAKIVAIFR
jgi:hypothetical protein